MPARSWPLSTMRPEVGVSKPASMRSSVVLPQPEEPSRAKTSPLAMSTETLSTARWPSNSLTMFLICRKASALIGTQGRLGAALQRRASRRRREGSALRLQHVGDRADRLVDVRLLDDQRRRQRDDVAGGADQDAALEALA